MSRVVRIWLLVTTLSFTMSNSQTRHVPSTHRTSLEHSQLLEVGRANDVAKVSLAPTDLKVLSYNIRWRGGEDLLKLIELLKADPEIGGADILGLQEVDRNKKRTGKTNTVKLLAGQLLMHYAWAAPPNTKAEQEEETGVAILSKYLLKDVHHIVLPNPGPGGRRRMALGATINVGETSIRFYSMHSENRISINRKIEQIKAVLEDLAGFGKDMPAVVLGDLNTWEPGAVIRVDALFKSAHFVTPFDNEKATFSRRILGVPINLKLDWIWFRGLVPVSQGIDKAVSLSDHWPMWAIVKMAGLRSRDRFQENKSPEASGKH